MTRSEIAEEFLRLLRETPGHPQARLYVVLAAANGVPVGRIANLSGLAAPVVIAYLEGGE